MWIIQHGMAVHSPEVTVKGFRNCCMSSAVDVTGDMLWNGSEGDGNVRSEFEEYADTAMAYRIYHALYKKHMKLI
jgi:hypothetical protein